MNMTWVDRCDGIQSNQINGTYYVRNMGGGNWFAEWCGPHDMEIITKCRDKVDCINECNKHYNNVIENAYEECFSEDTEGEERQRIFRMEDYR